MPSRAPQLLAAAAVVWALASAPPVSAAAADPRACTLLTQAQVSAAVGSSVTAGEPMGVNACNWSTTPAPKTAHVVVTLTLRDAKPFVDARTRPSPGIAHDAAGGIGDDAYFAQLGDLVTLNVKKGSSSFFVRVYGIKDVPRQRSIETTLARDVAPKL